MSIKFSHFEIEESSLNNVITIRLSGKLTVEDYEICVPELDRMIEAHGKVRIFLELVDFHGWTVAAAWEDTKFGVKHYTDIERLAIVGDKTWEKGMAAFCRPFTKAKIKYFNINELDEARIWISGE